MCKPTCHSEPYSSCGFFYAPLNTIYPVHLQIQGLVDLRTPENQIPVLAFPLIECMDFNKLLYPEEPQKLPTLGHHHET